MECCLSKPMVEGAVWSVSLLRQARLDCCLNKLSKAILDHFRFCRMNIGPNSCI
jgi:hypothetical protein